jgi:phospholipase C
MILVATSLLAAPVSAPPLNPIHHIVVIMQENRSFDSYFGTYPGAYGIPMRNGVPTVCNPDPLTGICVSPFHDSSDMNLGGPHGADASMADVDEGKMDGFIRQQLAACKAHPNDPECNRLVLPDAMGYHDRREIPNYWAYAHNFVLQDHMFEPVASWSLPSHLYLVSAWSAQCSNLQDPMSCKSDLNAPDPDKGGSAPDYAWTDVTYLLQKAGISWAYYVDGGSQRDRDDCPDGDCAVVNNPTGVPEIWNPLPDFETVHQDHQLNDVRKLTEFFAAAKNGGLPNVSWIIPNGRDSEHPPALLSTGQAYVTNIINTIMEGPDWGSVAIFLAWDDWGGFYDHVVPPGIDQNGYGIRVPGLVISPYAKNGYIDHQTLSFDAYLKFIEDNFLRGKRIDPATDGRPDSRPDVRENAAQLGSLWQDFDFSQPPRAPLILQPYPHSVSTTTATIRAQTTTKTTGQSIGLTVFPSLPGFPWESIPIGVIAGLVILAAVGRGNNRRPTNSVNSGKLRPKL